ncbi:hypothetical protein EON69_01350 [bacterium]|nr:MAG: hypothetical protein EON69_01350 [bacterium]
MILGSALQKVSRMAPCFGLSQNYRHLPSFLFSLGCSEKLAPVNIHGGKGVHHIYFQHGMRTADPGLAFTALPSQQLFTSLTTTSSLVCTDLLVQQIKLLRLQEACYG